VLILSCTALLTETDVLTHQSLGHSEGPVCHTLDTPTVPSFHSSGGICQHQNIASVCTRWTCRGASSSFCRAVGNRRQKENSTTSNVSTWMGESCSYGAQYGVQQGQREENSPDREATLVNLLLQSQNLCQPSVSLVLVLWRRPDF